MSLVPMGTRLEPSDFKQLRDFAEACLFQG
jgi:hypothetical protein